MNPHIQEIFSIFKGLNPEPQGELNFTTPYNLLVAVALSAQSTDVAVNKATKDLFTFITSPEDMLQLGEEGLIQYIKSIGLYKGKAKNIIKAAQILVEQFNGQVPQTIGELTILPGVGNKTAKVVLQMAFGQTHIAVDTHVFRISHRLDLSTAPNPDVVSDELMKNIPDEFLFHAHHWLILHGRYICKAQKPLCGQCPVAQFCGSKDKKIA